MFAFEHDIDYVALSFVRKAQDVSALRDFIIHHGPKGRKIPIIAKIEKGEAIANIDDILREADAVMVARGDLGVELPTEDVPILQKMIVRKCNEMGKPVIIATQMLESMIHHPTPTRAEANDVANAVLDGADAVMLSGETSVGEYPVQTVQVMDRIIRKVQDHTFRQTAYNPDWIPSTHEYDPLSRAACILADQLKASTIIVLTHSGSSAAHVAKIRPTSHHRRDRPREDHAAAEPYLGHQGDNCGQPQEGYGQDVSENTGTAVARRLHTQGGDDCDAGRHSSLRGASYEHDQGG
jgi:pyruvate kinase